MGTPPSHLREEAASGPVIVLVEDEALIRTLIFRILTMHGYRVEAFASGRDGLAWLEGRPEPPDLVITDVNMPGMSGKAFADEVCKRRPGTKILFISGYSPYTHEDMNGCGNQGDVLLRKPFRPEDMLERVKAILAQKPA
jgi:two-component system cell cycle sensor histidine kinase/response regulator CckA